MAEIDASKAALLPRQNFAEITFGGDPAAIAAAAAAEAEIKMRFLAAHQWPRDTDVAAEAILKDARDPRLAETALYRKPVGKKRDPETGQWTREYATNFSIRFMESCYQNWRNIHVITRYAWEDARAAKLLVTAFDSEANTSFSSERTLEKTVERRDARGRIIRAQRINSEGATVFLVDATEEEFKLKAAAEFSKMVRDNVQRLLPRSILDEARALIERTLSDDTAQNPDAAKKKILEAFGSLGIGVAALKEYLGQPVESLSPKDLAELRALYTGLKEGSLSWSEVLAAKRESESAGEGEDESAARPPLRDRVLNRRRQKEAEAAEKPSGPQPPDGN